MRRYCRARAQARRDSRPRRRQDCRVAPAQRLAAAVRRRSWALGSPSRHYRDRAAEGNGAVRAGLADLLTRSRPASSAEGVRQARAHRAAASASRHRHASVRPNWCRAACAPAPRSPSGSAARPCGKSRQASSHSSPQKSTILRACVSISATTSSYCTSSMMPAGSTRCQCSATRSIGPIIAAEIGEIVGIGVPFDEQLRETREAIVDRIAPHINNARIRQRQMDQACIYNVCRASCR